MAKKTGARAKKDTRRSGRGGRKRASGRTARGGARGKASKRVQVALRARDTSATDPFKHVVLLMLENRSFDHMLGALQAVVPDLDGVPSGGPPRTNPDTSGQLIGQLPVAEEVVDRDPKHENSNVLEQIQDRNGGFVKDYQLAYPDASATQIQAVMAYHRLDSLPALHQLGRAFAVFDRWFSSVPGPTWTNRLFALSGTSLGRVRMPQGIFQPNLHNYDQPSLFRRLEEAKRSLRIYFGDFPLALLFTDRRRPSAALRFTQLDSFFTDASGPEPSFPDFAFIEPRYVSAANDDHPPHAVGEGESLVAQVYAAIRRNAALWKSTLLVVAFDEHGGFYDHVSPPVGMPPDRHHEEYSFDRLGVRVPAILVSPWIEPQIVHTECEHTGLLSSLRRKWNLRGLGQRTHNAPDILASLRLAPSARDDTPERLLPDVPRAAAQARARMADPAKLNDHQAAIVAFSEYLESQTAAARGRKLRAAPRAMLLTPAQAGVVVEERAQRYLAQLREVRAR